MKAEKTKIMYEENGYWVNQTTDGTYEVYRENGTHSIRCAVIGYKGLDGLRRAKEECIKRAKNEVAK